MEVMIILLVIYGIVQVVARRVKQPTNATASDDKKPRTAAARASAKHHTPKPQPQQRQAAALTPRSEPIVAQPRYYQTLQPRVTDTERITDYGGSLGVATSEGITSGEGEDFCDPTLEHGRDTILSAANDVETPAIAALPEEWNAETLVRAVVMNEILNRPRKRRRA